MKGILSQARLTVEIDAGVFNEDIAVICSSRLEQHINLGGIDPLAREVAVGSSGHVFEEDGKTVVSHGLMVV
mgnify:CR=1 FL=1